MINEDCIFCKIANGELPSEFVFESENVVAFQDIEPQAPTHVLVVPKQHIETLNDLDDGELMVELLESIKSVAINLGIEDGYRTVLNTGSKAGQEVFHLHFHILSGRDFQWPPG